MPILRPISGLVAARLGECARAGWRAQQLHPRLTGPGLTVLPSPSPPPLPAPCPPPPPTTTTPAVAKHRRSIGAKQAAAEDLLSQRADVLEGARMEHVELPVLAGGDAQAVDDEEEEAAGARVKAPDVAGLIAARPSCLASYQLGVEAESKRWRLSRCSPAEARARTPGGRLRREACSSPALLSCPCEQPFPPPLSLSPHPFPCTRHGGGRRGGRGRTLVGTACRQAQG